MTELVSLNITEQRMNFDRKVERRRSHEAKWMNNYGATDEFDESSHLIKDARFHSSDSLSQTDSLDIEECATVDKIAKPLNSSLNGSLVGRRAWIFAQIKIGLVFILVFVASFIMTVIPESRTKFHQYIVSQSFSPMINITDTPQEYSFVLVRVRGAIIATYDTNIAELSNVTVHLHESSTNMSYSTDSWTVFVKPRFSDNIIETTSEHLFKLKEKRETPEFVSIIVESDSMLPIPIAVEYEALTTIVQYEVIYAAIILIFVYTLIIFELIHRTLAAMVGSMMVLAVLSLLNQRPTLSKVISWLDFETLSLLFGMMVLVAIFSETGFFDWVALQAYKFAKGKTWTLITLLCFFAAVISAFLDNVTTILLMAPVSIRLCEALGLDPKLILIAEVIFSNIGGTSTAIGDPPNVIIVSNSELLSKGINFTNFTLHMSLGIIFIAFGSFGLMRFLYRNVSDIQNNENKQIQETRRELEIWRRSAYSFMASTREQSAVKALLLQRAAEVDTRLSVLVHQENKQDLINYKQSLKDLEEKYKITDHWLLAKCAVVLGTVIILFFLSSVVESLHLNLGWIAIMGSIWLLVLADFADLETILHRVEWSTLIFFASLFALMEGLQELKLISFIGDQVLLLISSLPTSSQLPISIMLILWVSAICSSFIDNIPFTTAMIPIVLKLGEVLPLQPLVWALAFGACLGGNGTLIGASANVVAAGIAEQQGYGFTFKDFFKLGFPMMLFSTFLANIYLLICHWAIGWNY